MKLVIMFLLLIEASSAFDTCKTEIIECHRCILVQPFCGRRSKDPYSCSKSMEEQVGPCRLYCPRIVGWNIETHVNYLGCSDALNITRRSLDPNADLNPTDIALNPTNADLNPLNEKMATIINNINIYEGAVKKTHISPLISKTSDITPFTPAISKTSNITPVKTSIVPPVISNITPVKTSIVPPVISKPSTIALVNSKKSAEALNDGISVDTIGMICGLVLAFFGVVGGGIFAYVKGIFKKCHRQGSSTGGGEPEDIEVVAEDIEAAGADAPLKMLAYDQKKRIEHHQKKRIEHHQKKRPKPIEFIQKKALICEAIKPRPTSYP